MAKNGVEFIEVVVLAVAVGAATVGVAGALAGGARPARKAGVGVGSRNSAGGAGTSQAANSSNRTEAMR